MPLLFGLPVEFILFALTLLGVAIFHHYTMRAALAGLTSIALYKIFFTGFKAGPGLVGFLFHLGHEWVILVNLLGLLTGFALLSRHFEKSHVPVVLPKFMPHDWKGAFLLLAMVWVLSSFLDNIAGAMIGGAMAHQLFRAKVHIGYLAAIVAAANAGGAWSVVGDTTTTMMWIEGVSPLEVFEAIIASSIALCVFGSGRHSPTKIFLHSETFPRTHPHRLGTHRHRGIHSGSGSRNQPDSQPEVLGHRESLSIHRCRRVGGDSHLGDSPPAGLGSVTRNLQGFDLPSLVSPLCFDDAGGKIASRILADSPGTRFSLLRLR